MQPSKRNKNFVKIKGKRDLLKIPKILKDATYSVHKQSVNRSAIELYEYIKTVLWQQRFKWKPLKPKYKEGKLKKGLSGKILIATGDYYNAIRYVIGPRVSYVGLPNKIHKPSGLNYNYLARIHEFGTKTNPPGIPARPLWRPAVSWWIREWNSKHKRNMIVNTNKLIKEKLKKTR